MNQMTGGATVFDVGNLDGKTPFEKRPRSGQRDSCVSVDEADLAAFLAAAPELNSRLAKIEARILAHFGPDARIQRELFTPWDEEEAADQFHLRIVTEISFTERVDRLRAVLREEHELLAPARPPLTIGIL